jgi:hypothetical protein
MMHISFVHSAAAAAFGVFLALVSTPASAQDCDPAYCSNPYGPSGSRGLLRQTQAEPLCLFGPVVWVNAKSRVYHVAGSRDYGHTRHGAYMCESEAISAGNRAAPH